MKAPRHDHSGDPFLDGDGTIDYEGDAATTRWTTTMSRFWGVTWNRERKEVAEVLEKRRRQEALRRPIRRRGGGRPRGK